MTERLRPPTGPSVGSGSASVEARPATAGVPETDEGAAAVDELLAQGCKRELAPRLKAAVAASAELQDRDALKSVGFAAAMASALQGRGVPDPIAHLAAEMGVLAFKRGFAEWLEADHDAEGGLAHYTVTALEDLRAASASLS
jgi:hypothetical protein